MRKVIFLILSLFFLSANLVYADQNIRINEVRIEPEQSIEIVNTSDQQVDISGWFLDDGGGNTYFQIPPGSIVEANSCIVFTASFNLNKTSADIVRLFDNTAPPTSSTSALVDSYSYSSSPGANFSFSKVPDKNGEFKNMQSSLGLWNETGQSCLNSPAPSLSPSPVSTLTPEQTQEEDYEHLNNIFLSEVMVRPLSGNNEWVELYNLNDFSVTLTDWYIDDEENEGSLPKRFSTIIGSHQYATIEIETSMFNNGGDTIRLLDSDKQEIHSFDYLVTTENKTLGRESLETQNFCIQEPSKNLSNNNCLSIPSTVTPTKLPIPTKTPTPLKNLTATKSKSNTSSSTKPKNSPLTLKKDVSKSKVEHETEVLSTKINSHSPTSNSSIKTFSFLSISYSLLTITSVFLKMKLGYVQI